jgi:hypothetical protein
MKKVIARINKMMMKLLKLNQKDKKRHKKQIITKIRAIIVI